MESELLTDLSGYQAFFKQLTGFSPFDYQTKVARFLFAGRNIVLRAPTGAGKTWAVLAPFFYPEWKEGRPARLIYALPLRTLAQGIYREAREASKKLGLPVEGEPASDGASITPFVTLQTGEQPDDRFFDRGRIIVTTYDQLLSGLLNGPYGLSDRLHNVNSAVLAGSLVVFDEFHLMEPQKAFLTAAACLHEFQYLCQSVWMTATATSALEKVLGDSLDTVSVPSTESETAALLSSLQSVTRVRRGITVEMEPISAEAVLRHHEGRSIVLLNTVRRAQAMFKELKKRLSDSGSSIPLILLHSRFFKEDRREKELLLRTLFGRGSKGPAILVATQVVEAGIDISCDHLHTEICPMNALVQRAGRCARFEGEEGVVHVYPLVEENRAWLPYGDMTSESSCFAKTRDALAEVSNTLLDPRQAATRVQIVHGEEDESALREGWRERLMNCLRVIERNAFIRDPVRVSHLIRGDDTDNIRLIISEEASLPAKPGLREGVSISRQTLYGVFKNCGEDIGWFWNWEEDIPWKSITSLNDLKMAYVICLRPDVAYYDGDVGLLLGVPGVNESPERQEPPRPGYAPLRAEAWADHIRRVAGEAERRLVKEYWQGGLLGRGFERRYGLPPEAIFGAVRACAFLHDLGKLQIAWQQWAEAAQKAKDPAYRHDIPLAHTDFDPGSPEDRKRERTLGISRPPHAPAAAYYGRVFLTGLLSLVPYDRKAYVASSCIAAVLAHHGGWWQSEWGIHPPNLVDNWENIAAAAFGFSADQKALAHIREYEVEKLLKSVTSGEGLMEWWPLVAYLTRTLRLSDQRATEEGAQHE